MIATGIHLLVSLTVTRRVLFDFFRINGVAIRAFSASAEASSSLPLSLLLAEHRSTSLRSGASSSDATTRGKSDH